MFVDASAMVAILAPEDDGVAIATRLEASRDPTTTPLAIFETVVALRRIHAAPIGDVLAITHAFLERSGTNVVGIDSEQHVTALHAFERYGRGSGHPAQLNFGDCFAYAAAKRLGLPILYKGNDFALTDLR
jgi:ribonuclease VapC